MTREEYMYQKIAELSPVNKDLSQKMVNHLGEWTTINEVAKYFKKHRNTIYDKVDNGDIFYRKLGTGILIYTRSLIFLLE